MAKIIVLVICGAVSGLFALYFFWKAKNWAGKLELERLHTSIGEGSFFNAVRAKLFAGLFFILALGFGGPSFYCLYHADDDWENLHSPQAQVGHDVASAGANGAVQGGAAVGSQESPSRPSPPSLPPNAATILAYVGREPDAAFFQIPLVRSAMATVFDQDELEQFTEDQLLHLDFSKCESESGNILVTSWTGKISTGIDGYVLAINVANGQVTSAHQGDEPGITIRGDFGSADIGALPQGVQDWIQHMRAEALKWNGVAAGQIPVTFVKRSAFQTAATEARDAQIAGDTTQGGALPAQSAWESIKDSLDPHLFERFLRDYPDSQYAEEARLKAATLTANTNGGGAYRAGGGVTAPTLQHKVEPEYSEEARKAKVQGTVVLYVEVDTTGKATNIHVLRSLGLGLDEKAIEAVKQWTFIPGKKNGVPVAVQATVEVNFRLL